MENETIIDIRQLEDERDQLSLRVDELKLELGVAEQRQHDIGTLLSMWARIRGLTPSSPVAEVNSYDRAELPDSTVRKGTEPKKRIPSTRMVVDLIRSKSRTWTREDVHVAFEEAYGIPETWANPANALNNAIARGVQSGQIEETPDGYRAI